MKMKPGKFKLSEQQQYLFQGGINRKREVVPEKDDALLNWAHKCARIARCTCSSFATKFSGQQN